MIMTELDTNQSLATTLITENTSGEAARPAEPREAPLPTGQLDPPIHRALDSGADPRSLARQIVDYLRGLMLIQMGNDDQVEVTKNVKNVMVEHAKAFSTSDVLRMMRAFNTAATDTRGGWQPSLSLELAVAEVLEAPTEVPVARQEEKPTRAKKAEHPAQKVVTKGEPEKAKTTRNENNNGIPK